MAEKSKNNVTMHDIAKKARTSIATVSRVINGNQSVSKPLERRVRKAMKDLHYHPSSLARSLKMSQTMLVGILVPLLEHPGYGRMAMGVEKELFEHGYRGLICNSEEDEDRENAYIEMLLRQRVDGIIVNTSARNPEYLAELQKNDIPIVLFDRTIQGIDCHQVFCDNSLGGYTGIQHLAELGHKRIGVIAAPIYSDEYPEPIARRLQGVRDAMKVYGSDNDPELVQTGATQLFDMGYKAGKTLLELDNPPTAIFSLTDVTAVGVVHAAAEKGVRIPEDLSIVGYDDLPIASYTVPPMTTIAQPLVKMGQVAAQVLIQSINDPESAPERAVLPTKLVVRESTAPPNK